MPTCEFRAIDNPKDNIQKVKGALSNYIFIKCVLDEGLWNLLRTTTGVAVIPTTGGFPVAISEQEIKKMKEKVIQLNTNTMQKIVLKK